MSGQLHDPRSPLCPPHHVLTLPSSLHQWLYGKTVQGAVLALGCFFWGGAALIVICIKFLHYLVYDLTGLNAGYSTEIGNM